MGLCFAEQHVEHIKQQTCTSKQYGTPAHITTRRKSQKMHFHNFWDSGSQNKTSETSKTALSELMGLWFAEQNVGNIKTVLSQTLGL